MMKVAGNFAGRVLIGLGLLVWCAGCERGASSAGPSEGGAEAAATADVLPAGLLQEQEPAGAMDIIAVKAAPPANGEVVVRGVIAGRAEPFIEGRAMFLLADLSLTAKHKQRHGDAPLSPCCAAEGASLANTATIQVVGDDGRPLRVGLRGQHGLEPLAEVVVVGEVATPEGGDALVINARGIHVVKR
jgi:hypothetical protein